MPDCASGNSVVSNLIVGGLIFALLCVGVTLWVTRSRWMQRGALGLIVLLILGIGISDSQPAFAAAVPSDCGDETEQVESMPERVNGEEQTQGEEPTSSDEDSDPETDDPDASHRDPGPVNPDDRSTPISHVGANNNLRITWAEPTLALSVPEGELRTVFAHFSISGQSSSTVSVVTSSELSTIVTTKTSSVFEVSTGVFALPVEVAAPTASPGYIVGTIELHSNGHAVSDLLSFQITVTPLSSTTIPATPASVAPDRLVDVHGSKYARDQLTVALSLAVRSPESVIRNIASNYGATIVGSVPDARLYDLRFDSAAFDPNLLSSYASSLRTNRFVLAVTRTVFAEANFVPDDPVWEGSNPDKTWGLEMIEAPEAWDTATGHGVTVGIIDAGFDAAHPDLRSNIVYNAGLGNFAPHGTHVAGTACGSGDNGVGITGVAYDCDLVLQSILNGKTSPSEFIAAMRAVAAQSPRVVNVSYGWGTSFDCTASGLTSEQSADYADVLGMATLFLEQARAFPNILWVVSAGNNAHETENAQCESFGQLGNYPTIVSVAAVKSDGSLATYSKRGPLVSVAAPGGALDGGPQIYSTSVLNCPLLPGRICGDGYAYKSGTSMAAPHVTGIAALIAQANPALTAGQIKTCIIDSAENGGRAVPGQPFSVVNAREAVECSADSNVAAAPSEATWGWGTAPLVTTNASFLPIPLDVPAPVQTKVTSSSTLEVFVRTEAGELWRWSSADDPAKVLGLPPVIDLATDAGSKIVLDSTGKVWSWGIGTTGALGHGSTGGLSVPTQIAGLPPIINIETSVGTTFALSEDGRLFAWGRNNYGRLGSDRPAIVTSPVEIAGLPAIARFWVERRVVFAVDTDGALWTWGGRYSHNNGRPGSSAVPAEVPGLLGAVKVAATHYNNSTDAYFVIDSSGHLWSWGDNNYGVLGQGSTTPSGIATRIDGLTQIKDVAAMGFTAVAIDQSGRAWAWGAGPIGNGSSGGSTSPARVMSLDAYVLTEVHGALTTLYAVDASGRVWAWGNGYYGTLGNGGQSNTSVPVLATGLDRVEELWVYSSPSLVIGRVKK